MSHWIHSVPHLSDRCIAIGPHSGNRTLPLHDPSFIRTDKPTKASTADRAGFSRNAAVSCQPYQRERLQRLCRHVTRPAICFDRLTVRFDGTIQYELKNPFSNGTTHILFSPLDLLSNLAALVSRPRYNLARYHGIFAPNAKIRKLIVPKNGTRFYKKAKGKEESTIYKTPEEPTKRDKLVAHLTWPQRRDGEPLKRVFSINISLCPLCGGTTRVIGRGRLRITDPDIIQKILDHIDAQPPLKPATSI